VKHVGRELQQSDSTAMKIEYLNQDDFVSIGFLDDLREFSDVGVYSRSPKAAFWPITPP